MQAPDFSLQNSEGKTVKLSSFAGSFLGLGAKPVVRAMVVIMVFQKIILCSCCVRVWAGVGGAGLGR